MAIIKVNDEQAAQFWLTKSYNELNNYPMLKFSSIEFDSYQVQLLNSGC